MGYVTLLLAALPFAFASPNVILMFMSTNSGLSLPRLWSNWLEQAQRFGIKHIIHVDGDAPELEYFPPNSVFVQNPASCSWGHLMPCETRLFQAAYELSENDDDMFVLVSADSVPLKTPQYVYEFITRTKSSKGRVLVEDYKDGSPKHGQWLALNKEHLGLLIEPEFVNKKFVWHPRERVCITRLEIRRDVERCHVLAAADEYEPLAWLQHRGVDLTTEFENATITYDCWEHCRRLGECIYGRAPCIFEKVYAAAMRAIMETPDILFLRKVSRGATVLNYYDYELAEYNLTTQSEPSENDGSL